METEKIVAMAAAAIAEELNTDIRAIRVLSFREKSKSSLEQYISEHHIDYTKYQLGATVK